MTGRATSNRVWLVFEDDISHGIQAIHGVYATEERAQAEATVREIGGLNIVVEEWPIYD